jgi:hypothetical protein
MKGSNNSLLLCWGHECGVDTGHVWYSAGPDRRMVRLARPCAGIHIISHLCAPACVCVIGLRSSVICPVKRNRGLPLHGVLQVKPSLPRRKEKASTPPKKGQSPVIYPVKHKDPTHRYFKLSLIPRAAMPHWGTLSFRKSNILIVSFARGPLPVMLHCIRH